MHRPADECDCEGRMGVYGCVFMGKNQRGKFDFPVIYFSAPRAVGGHNFEVLCAMCDLWS